MRFTLKLILKGDSQQVIPINYQYPLSAAIYKILDSADKAYAAFLHKDGYGKGYKLFTFSDLKGKFKVRGDRMNLLNNMVELTINFHMPEASRKFIEGLFKTQVIVIADKKSKATFEVATILSMRSPWEKEIGDNELVQLYVRPASAIVAAVKKDDGNYTFIAPNDENFIETLTYNWRNKIATLFDEQTAQEALLMMEVDYYPNPYRSRLITIKAGTPEETKIRGFLNFKLKLTAEKRFVELLLNTGAGVYNAQGMGCLEVVEDVVT